jgi:hypothetical protein
MVGGRNKSRRVLRTGKGLGWRHRERWWSRADVTRNFAISTTEARTEVPEFPTLRESGPRRFISSYFPLIHGFPMPSARVSSFSEFNQEFNASLGWVNPWRLRESGRRAAWAVFLIMVRRILDPFNCFKAAYACSVTSNITLVYYRK